VWYSSCYCIFGRGKINAWFPRSARARDFVNFRGENSCIARARRARAGLTVYPPSRTFEPLAFDEYCRFVTSAFFMRIKRGSYRKLKVPTFVILPWPRVQYSRKEREIERDRVIRSTRGASTWAGRGGRQGLRARAPSCLRCAVSPPLRTPRGRNG
jgi:hypothetical protein